MTTDTPSNGKHANQSSNSSQKNGFVWGEGISLEVSQNKLSAIIEIDIEHADHYSIQDVERFLRGNNITYNIDVEAIQRLFDEKLFNQPIVVAKGTPTQHGEHGKVDWKIDLSILDGAQLVEKHGRVDWKDMHHLLQVEEDELIAVMIDPTQGENGITVYGEELPATPGKEVKFPAGKGVRISEDGKELYATLAGAVCMENGKISISPVYNVKGDVNYSTGNIDYDETIEITGGVLPEFSVKAGQDIHVNGLVEAAYLEAGGSIYINGGIQGDQKAVVKAHGDIVVKYINNATVESGGHIIVNGSITNSVVRAGGKIVVEGPKAVIVGGICCAETEISAAIFGSELGVKTELELGRSILEKIQFRNEQNNKINTLVANYNKIRQATKTMNQLRDLGKLNKKQEEIRLKITRSGLQLQSQIKRMQEENDLAKTEIEKAQKEIIGVIGREVTWPGVKITILGHSYLVKTMTSKAVFALTGNEINAFAFKDEKKSKKEKKEKDQSAEPATSEQDTSDNPESSGEPR